MSARSPQRRTCRRRHGPGLVTGICGTFGFISLGFLADAMGRKPVTMLFYLMCTILTPVVYLAAWSIDVLLVWVAVFGSFTLGNWAWTPVWLQEIFRPACAAPPSASALTRRA